MKSLNSTKKYYLLPLLLLMCFLCSCNTVQNDTAKLYTSSEGTFNINVPDNADIKAFVNKYDEEEGLPDENVTQIILPSENEDVPAWSVNIVETTKFEKNIVHNEEEAKKLFADMGLSFNDGVTVKDVKVITESGDECGYSFLVDFGGNSGALYYMSYYTDDTLFSIQGTAANPDDKSIDESISSMRSCIDSFEPVLN